MKLHFILPLLAILFLFSCKKGDCEDAEKATFKDATGTDGCGMLIELSDGKLLEPQNLNEFDITVEDGNKIWVSYHLAESGGTICMVGDVVVIDCISER
jgi:hypothetical protein